MDLILAIDDDTTLLELLKIQLGKLGYNVITASDGKTGVGLAETGNPDLIILDISMPGYDGFHVLKTLREKEVTRNTPVLMLTAKSAKEDVIASMKFDVVDYILKPFDIQMLSRKVEIALYHSILLSERSKNSNSLIINRRSGKTIISFMDNMSNARMIKESKRLLNSTFIKTVKNDAVILDLRGLSEVEQLDLEILKKMSEGFSSGNLFFVAGRHYGFVVAGVEFIDTERIFISMGDCEIYIDSLI